VNHAPCGGLNPSDNKLSGSNGSGKGDSGNGLTDSQRQGFASLKTMASTSFNQFYQSLVNKASSSTTAAQPASGSAFQRTKAPASAFKSIPSLMPAENQQ